MARTTKALSRKNPFLEGLNKSERSRYIRNLQRQAPHALQNSLLFDLPAELRNRIYQLVLVSDECIEVDAAMSTNRARTRSETKRTNRSGPVIREPALLQSCGIIRGEATQMYYALNRFASSCKKLLYWMKGLGTTKQAMLRDIRVLRNGKPRREVRQLQELYIIMDCLESGVRRYGMTVPPPFLSAYHAPDSPETALTQAGIEARLTDEQLTAARQAMLSRKQVRRTEV